MVRFFGFIAHDDTMGLPKKQGRIDKKIAQKKDVIKFFCANLLDKRQNL
jgi:hypothetical protein